MLYLGASPTEILWKGTKAPVFNRKQLCALLIPLMLEQILASLMGMADTMMVSNVGSHAIAAVSLVDSLNIVMINLFSAMATGGSIICSQYIGRDDLRQANETARQLLLSITAISLVIGAVCLTLRRPLLSLIFGRVEDTVMENAEVYMLITALSFPFLAMYNAGAALFRASGNSRLPMTVSILSNIINIIGNAILIFGLKMGVLGAAIPTLLGRVFCAVVILYKLRQPHQKIIVHDYRAIRPDFKRIGHILRIGVPTGVENSMFQFGKLVIQSTVSTLGTAAIAANAMAAMVEGFVGNASVGVGLGLMTVVGQCMGAGHVEEARRYILKLSFLGRMLILLFCAMAAVLINPVTVIAGMEPDAAQMTVQMVWLICAYKPLMWSTSFMLAYGMRAAGDVKFSLVTSSVTMWTCRVIITVLLIRVFHMGPVAVWIGMFSDWTARSIAYVWRFRSGRWAQHQVIEKA